MGYVAAHQAPVDGGYPGLLQLAADFGEEAPVSGNLDEVRAHLEAIQQECDRDDLRHFNPTEDMDRVDMEAFARDIQASLGIVYEHADQALALLPKVDGGAPPPPPSPNPDAEEWAHLLSDVPVLVGRQKWHPDGMGLDLFCRRETPVRAPMAGTWWFEQVPGGPMLIGQGWIIAASGKAVRFRHVAPQGVQSGARVELGQICARVWDPSMDTLTWPRGAQWGIPPDGYQHLDLSLASSRPRMNPEGGAGGDVKAWTHVFEQYHGLPNTTVVERTPGPTEGLRGYSKGTPEERRWKRQWTGWTLPAPARGATGA